MNHVVPRSYADAISVADALSWLSHGQDPAYESHLLETDQAALLEAATQHKVVGRFLEALMRSGLDVRLPVLMSGLRVRFTDDLYQMNRKADVTESLLLRMPEDCREVILLKGPNCAWLTGNAFHTKRSGDVDLLVRDPTRFRNGLMSAGFSDAWMPAGHEEINIQLDGIIFDIHKYFPVYRSQETDPVSPQASGLALHNANFNVKQLSFDAVKAKCLSASIGQSLRALRPSPAMAAFISTVHLFTDFARPYASILRYRPMVRIADMLEIQDLIRHADFDQTVFSNLIQEFDLASEIRQVGQLMSQITGNRDLLADFEGPSAPSASLNEEHPPSSAVFLGFGFQTALKLNLTDLIGSPLGLTGVLQRITTTVVDLPKSKIVDLSCETCAVVHQHGDGFDWKINISRDASCLLVQVEFPRAGFDNPYISVTADRSYFRLFPGTDLQQQSQLISLDEGTPGQASLQPSLKTFKADVRLTHHDSSTVLMSVLLANMTNSVTTRGIFIPIRLLIS